MSRGDHAEPGVKRLNEAQLRTGDIILVTTTATVSAIIRAATRSDISHAMVYVEDRSIIDATDEGVQARNTQRLFIEAACPVHILRLRNGISADQLTAVRDHLRSTIGTRYSKREAVLAGVGGARRWTRQQFCSRLVAQAFASAGIGLVPDPNYCSPADLKASDLLHLVPDATLPVTVEEAAAWEGREDVPQLMRDAINWFLGGARGKDPRIETFGDLNAHLAAHPDQDEEICHLLETSGYLSVWQVEQAENPWQYDVALMNAIPADQIVDYCWSVLSNEDGSPNRYVVNRGAYSFLYRLHGLRFFREMAHLHELLSTLHRQRVETAAQWLEAHGHLRREPPAALTPHSEEWFAALERWDPAQAQMTMQVIRMAGRADVCSVCGDDPADDYRLHEQYRSAEGVDTLRLCDDCLQIRRAGGEPFVTMATDEERSDGA